MKEIKGLSYEMNKKLRSSIDAGYLDDYEENPRAWKHTLPGAFLWRYHTRSATLNRLRSIVGHIPTWDDITDEVLRDFVDDTVDAMAASSARTICAELKAVLHENKRKIPSENFMTILTVKGEASQAVYLTREEMMRIIGYKPISDIERFVRRNFIVEFLTGARRRDAERLTVNHCDIDTGMLSYVPDKTPGIIVTVPVDERLHLREFLADECRKRCCERSFNNILRRICKECRIDTPCTIYRCGASITAPKYDLVSSHTARRSFATNLYLSGVSLEDIAVLMGHGKNIETTKRYICAERAVSSNVLAYFQPVFTEPVKIPQNLDDVYEEEPQYAFRT